MPASPLEGVRVLSVGHTLPGMYCMAILRDLGAGLTRIERPAGSDNAPRYEGIAGQFPTESLVGQTSECRLDLKSPGGRGAFVRMAGQADVVLEGFRPGVAARLGINYATLSLANPRLIYAAISGYGQDGPCRERVGHDINYMAGAGVLDLTGPPSFPGVTAADGMAGSNAALNVLAALQARQRTGAGAFLDVAIIDGPLFLMSMELERCWQTGESRTRGDTHLTGRYPWYRLYETSDGRYVSVGAVEPAFYARLCTLIGRPDLARRQFAAGAELAEQHRVFEQTFKSKTREEWAALLAAEETCVAPVLTPGEAAEAPQNQRAFIEPNGREPRRVRSPVHLPLAPAQPERDTTATLASYGFSAKEIKDLQAQGVVGT